MASSRKSKPGKLDSPLERAAEALAGIVGAGDRLVIGLSGGIDSVVLLDILIRLAPRLKFKLSAVHVNHQLSPNASRWARFCRSLCRARGIPLRVVKVDVARGDSIEAAARAARYQVFSKLRADYVVLAHNQDDQAETLLLQMLRGAGVRGLAAMPLVGQIKGYPLRFHSGQASTAYLQACPESFDSASLRSGRTAVKPFVLSYEPVLSPSTQLRTGFAEGKHERRSPSTPLRSAQDERQTPFVLRLSKHERRSPSTPLRSAQGERRRGMLSVLRPLLDVPRKDIEAYARKRGLEWVEDESNAETYFLRNFLRHEIFPVIARRYPAYRATLSRAARNLAEAAQLLDELAAADLAAQGEPGTLAVSALRALTFPRAKNLLRCFISSHGISAPPADRLNEGLRQVLTAKQDARVQVELEDAQLRRFAGRVYVVRNMRSNTPRFVRRWRGETEIALPQLGGVLVLARGREGGISLARLREREVTIAVRAGGERLQLYPNRPRRSLKNLLQEARIPPWQRERMPLIYCDGKVVWAAGLGVDCAYRAPEGESALCPAWRPV